MSFFPINLLGDRAQRVALIKPTRETMVFSTVSLAMFLSLWFRPQVCECVSLQ